MKKHQKKQPRFVRGLLSEESGQAALVDSLFFIAIVSAIVSGLFYFAINYGSSTEQLMSSFYSSDFAMDSLKVVTYINLNHNGSAINLNDTDPTAPKEYDYLLTLIKQDYARTGEIGIDTRVAIANTLYSVLKPFDDSMDYTFDISRESSQTQDKYLALIIAAHVCGEQPSDVCNVSDPNNRVLPRRVFYSCKPDDPMALEKYLYPYVGRVDQALGKITLGRSIGSSNPYILELHVWISKKANVLQDPNNSLKNPNVAYDLNCEILPVQTLQPQG